MNLARLQLEFQAYLTDNTAKHPFHMEVVDDANVGASKRLNIYHDAYRARFVEVLTTVYPNLNKLLGDERFIKTVHGFISQYPSTYRNMRWVGGEMAQYLREAMPQKPLAADIAEFEWGLGLAFDSADVPTLSLQDISAIPPDEWGDLRFSLHPSVQIKQANTDVIAAWQALENGRKPRKSANKTSTYLIWRQAYDSYFKSLDAVEGEAIQRIASGHTFGQLCEKLAGLMGDQAGMNAAAGYLAQWLNAELLIRSDAQ